VIEQPLHRRPDSELIAALRSIEPTIAWPTAAPSASGPDLASAVRARIETASPRVEPDAVTGRPAGWLRPRWAWRPARRALLIAVAALIALAAIAGAAGLGLPGLRLLFGGGSVSPPPSLEPSRSPSPGGPGASMSLGEPVSPADPAALDARAGFAVTWPADPLVGRPDAAYIDETKRGQVSLVWAARPDLPATLEPGVGLVMTEFRGSVDSGFFDKVVGSGTTVESVLVDGRRGYWLSGAPHFFFYEGRGGGVQDERRWVGDALLWSNGSITYRLESALGRDATIRVAESLP
jgi:hypothetical protein